MATLTSTTRYRAAGAAGVLCIALALGLGAGTAQAQQPGSSLEIYQDPVIVGNPVVGNTLTSSGGAWRSPDVGDTESWWEWWRCPTDRLSSQCRFQVRSTSYTLREEDRTGYLFLARYIELEQRGDDERRLKVSTPTGPVVNPPPPPPPPPAATPTPSPTPVPPVGATPTPAPTFDTGTALPAPVGTGGPLLQDTATSRRAIRPFPIVRMRGRLTSSGARVTLLSVRAPRAAKISIRCKGSCPTRRWSRSDRKSRLTRVGPFERTLRSGTVLTVSVTRKGYVGKRTTFYIRRGVAPLRTDRCLATNGRTTRCPAGV